VKNKPTLYIEKILSLWSKRSETNGIVQQNM